jgi:hypothetical protein
MCLRVSYKKKYEKNIFFAISEVTEAGSVRQRYPNQNVTDP